MFLFIIIITITIYIVVISIIIINIISIISNIISINIIIIIIIIISIIIIIIINNHYFLTFTLISHYIMSTCMKHGKILFLIEKIREDHYRNDVFRSFNNIFLLNLFSRKFSYWKYLHMGLIIKIHKNEHELVLVVNGQLISQLYCGTVGLMACYIILLFIH